MFQKIIPWLMTAAGYDGYHTNHSLCVSAATRLFAAGVDEQLIMSRIGHSGVRTYKHKVEKLQEITSDVFNTGSVGKGESCTANSRESDEAVGKKKNKTMQNKLMFYHLKTRRCVS